MNKLNSFLVEYPLAVSIISVLSSAIIGFVTAVTIPSTAINSILIGFLSLITFTLLQLTAYALQIIGSSAIHSTDISNMNELMQFNSNLSKLNQEPHLRKELICIVDKAEQAITALTAAEVDSKLDEVFKEEIAKHVTRAKESIEQIQSGTLRVVGDEAHTLWSRMVENVEESFFTTNIFRFKGVLLGARPNQHLLTLQGDVAKRLGKGKFERLFVFEDNDTEEVKHIINEQRGVGIHAWSISREKFDRLSRDGSWIEKIGSDDFTIIDNKYLYLSTIDPRTERVLYVDLYRGGVRLTSAIEFANRIRDIEKLFVEEGCIEVSK